MVKHSLTEHFVDLHLVIFVGNWNGDREDRLNALQSYAVAWVDAMDAKDESTSERLVGKVIAQAMKIVARPPTAPNLTQLQWLRGKFEEWAREQFSDEASVIAGLMMPLRYAERIIPYVDNASRCYEEHQAFCTDEGLG